jgi:hypothetical protein
MFLQIAGRKQHISSYYQSNGKNQRQHAKDHLLHRRPPSSLELLEKFGIRSAGELPRPTGAVQFFVKGSPYETGVALTAGGTIGAAGAF